MHVSVPFWCSACSLDLQLDRSSILPSLSAATTPGTGAHSHNIFYNFNLLEQRLCSSLKFLLHCIPLAETVDPDLYD